MPIFRRSASLSAALPALNSFTSPSTVTAILKPRLLWQSVVARRFQVTFRIALWPQSGFFPLAVLFSQLPISARLLFRLQVVFLAMVPLLHLSQPVQAMMAFALAVVRTCLQHQLITILSLALMYWTGRGAKFALRLTSTTSPVIHPAARSMVSFSASVRRHQPMALS